ncbi:nucleotidyltransferase, partial [Breznakia sp. OttesenSCG-928-G09]|nr:nucleotidyltransferase [Breznakia sp. OttesenSCG-928-G09]
MKKTSLVVLAAGMGSRYGGLKQIDKIGPNGEVILELSVYDAIQAGFNEVIFIIKKAIEADFKSAIGDKISKQVNVKYVYQEIDNSIPQGFEIPEGREKPWGTGHALLCCEGVIDSPFAVINADDYYGREGFEKLHD